MSESLVAGGLIVMLVLIAEMLRGARVVALRRALNGGRGPVGIRGLLLVAAAVAVVLAIRAAPESSSQFEAGPPGAVMLLVDVSHSMLVADGSPDRMSQAHMSATQLLASIPDVRVGLVAFAARAHVVLPPTTDHQLVQRYLQVLDPGVMTAQGSDLAAALELAAGEVARADSAYGASPRGLVVLSDGESFEEEGRLARVLSAISSGGLPVHVVAVGSEQGGPVPGARVGGTSRANHARLASIAEATGGVAVLGDSRRLPDVADRLQARASQPAMPEAPAQRGSAGWLAGVALVLLLLESGLGATVGRLT